VKRVYLIGSLRNPAIPLYARHLRDHRFEVFDDWFAAGPEADDYWQKYEQGRGRTYAEALKGAAATNVFRFDEKNLKACDVAVMVMPAGKSAHLELGFSIGMGKKGVILLDKEPERFDVMYRFADAVVVGVDALVETLLSTSFWS
jgi:hypothetical protein